MKITDKVWKRFESKIMRIPESGCWIWMGSINKGYGRFTIGRKKSYQAHRISYEYLKGKIPDGLEIDHLCRVRCCVNPNHLEAVTAKVNMLRGISPAAINAKKTHCARGHEYNEENSYGTNRERRCLVCRRVPTELKKKLGRPRVIKV